MPWAPVSANIHPVEAKRVHYLFFMGIVVGNENRPSFCCGESGNYSKIIINNSNRTIPHNNFPPALWDGYTQLVHAFEQLFMNFWDRSTRHFTEISAR